MAIPSSWDLVGNALYENRHSLLVVSDLHLGKRTQIEPYPEMEHDEIEERLIEKIEKKDVEEIVFNGDTFNHYPVDERSIQLFNSLSDQVDKLTFVEGNHEENFDGFPQEIEDYYETADYVVRNELIIHHGHKEYDSDEADFHVIGHLHPVHKGQDVFLWNDSGYNEKGVLVLPGFSDTLGGCEITEVDELNHSPIIEKGTEIQKYDTIFCR